jgi:RHS repeat-associated protein
MMIPEDWVDATEGQSLPSTGSFTGKELDPDFVDFNSVNRRYHFPARFYLPMRGMFGQVDPLTTMAVGIAPFQLSGYSYVDCGPTTRVDPYGLLACGGEETFKKYSVKVIKGPWSNLTDDITRIEVQEWWERECKRLQNEIKMDKATACEQLDCWPPTQFTSARCTFSKPQELGRGTLLGLVASVTVRCRIKRKCASTRILVLCLLPPLTFRLPHECVAV